MVVIISLYSTVQNNKCIFPVPPNQNSAFYIHSIHLCICHLWPRQYHRITYQNPNFHNFHYCPNFEYTLYITLLTLCVRSLQCLLGWARGGEAGWRLFFYVNYPMVIIPIWFNTIRIIAKIISIWLQLFTWSQVCCCCYTSVWKGGERGRKKRDFSAIFCHKIGKDAENHLGEIFLIWRRGRERCSSKLCSSCHLPHGSHNLWKFHWKFKGGINSNGILLGLSCLSHLEIVNNTP